MIPSATPDEIRADLSARECGPCFACCVWLGVEAKIDGLRRPLRKFPGQSCKFLDSRDDPTKMCRIYDNRPHACERFLCGWRAGFLSVETGRPDKSGLLLSLYQRDEIDAAAVPPRHVNNVQPGDIVATVVIIDPAKCGELKADSPIQRLLDELVHFGVTDIRIVNYRTKFVLHLIDGLVYRGQLTKAHNPENLNFVDFDPPIGKFLLKDPKEGNEE